MRVSVTQSFIFLSLPIHSSYIKIFQMIHIYSETSKKLVEVILKGAEWSCSNNTQIATFCIYLLASSTRSVIIILNHFWHPIASIRSTMYLLLNSALPSMWPNWQQCIKNNKLFNNTKKRIAQHTLVLLILQSIHYLRSILYFSPMLLGWIQKLL